MKYKILSPAEIIALLVIGAFLCIAYPYAYGGEDFFPEDGNWVGKPQEVLPPHPDKDKAEKQRIQAFCFTYIKRLKALWYDIQKEGAEAMLKAHPPSDEGVSMEYARKLATEIEGIDYQHAQAWIEEKWNSCLADPMTVGK